jgi:glycosyltransferase involved in cell wall biosynthesis
MPGARATLAAGRRRQCAYLTTIDLLLRHPHHEPGLTAQECMTAGPSPRELHSLRNGIDFGSRARVEDSEVATIRRALGIPEHAFVVGSMFRFAAEKRPLLWIDTAAFVAKRIPQAHFLIFGQGHMKAEMEARVVDVGLGDRFTIAEVTHDILSAMSIMDVLMLTSFGEGTPNVVLEAQWVGTPVVATQAGGTAEAVDSGVTGWIVADASPQTLANRVVELYANPNLQQRARDRGLEFLRSRFGVGRMIEETWEAYGMAPVTSLKSTSFRREAT